MTLRKQKICTCFSEHSILSEPLEPHFSNNPIPLVKSTNSNPGSSAAKHDRSSQVMEKLKEHLNIVPNRLTPDSTLEVV